MNMSPDNRRSSAKRGIGMSALSMTEVSPVKSRDISPFRMSMLSEESPIM